MRSAPEGEPGRPGGRTRVPAGAVFDLLVADFDRHRKQWRWARRAGGRGWHPIPEDRDQAFARYEGLLVRSAAGYVPQLRAFGPDYDRIHGLTFNGREQDRWLLPELARETWREAAEDLRARLFDVLISDFDRHRKQWRWMRRPGDPLWHPLPEDRDQAFARYEGLIVRAAAGFVPQIRTFGDKYDKILGLTYNGREQDRGLLAELEREAWHAEAGALQAALSDEVLERAARRMPVEWYPFDGPRLVAALKKRRDALVKEAQSGC